MALTASDARVVPDADTTRDVSFAQSDTTRGSLPPSRVSRSQLGSREQQWPTRAAEVDLRAELATAVAPPATSASVDVVAAASPQRSSMDDDDWGAPDDEEGAGDEEEGGDGEEGSDDGEQDEHASQDSRTYFDDPYDAAFAADVQQEVDTFRDNRGEKTATPLALRHIDVDARAELGGAGEGAGSPTLAAALGAMSPLSQYRYVMRVLESERPTPGGAGDVRRAPTNSAAAAANGKLDDPSEYPDAHRQLYRGTVASLGHLTRLLSTLDNEDSDRDTAAQMAEKELLQASIEDRLEVLGGVDQLMQQICAKTHRAEELHTLLAEQDLMHGIVKTAIQSLGNRHTHEFSVAEAEMRLRLQEQKRHHLLMHRTRQLKDACVGTVEPLADMRHQEQAIDRLLVEREDAAEREAAENGDASDDNGSARRRGDDGDDPSAVGGMVLRVPGATKGTAGRRASRRRSSAAPSLAAAVALAGGGGGGGMGRALAGARTIARLRAGIRSNSPTDTSRKAASHVDRSNDAPMDADKSMGRLRVSYPPHAPPARHVVFVHVEVPFHELSQSAWAIDAAIVLVASSRFVAALMRQAAAHRGYAVAVTRFSATLAFDEEAKAAQFVLDVDQDLTGGGVEWPGPLLRYEATSVVTGQTGPGGEVLHRGLRAAFGIHIAHVSHEPPFTLRVETDIVTKRVQYYGPAATVATALVRSFGRGGEVLCTQDAWELVKMRTPALVTTSFATREATVSIVGQAELDRSGLALVSFEDAKSFGKYYVSLTVACPVSRKGRLARLGMLPHEVTGGLPEPSATAVQPLAAAADPSSRYLLRQQQHRSGASWSTTGGVGGMASNDPMFGMPVSAGAAEALPLPNLKAIRPSVDQSPVAFVVCSVPHLAKLLSLPGGASGQGVLNIVYGVYVRSLARVNQSRTFFDTSDMSNSVMTNSALAIGATGSSAAIRNASKYDLGSLVAHGYDETVLIFRSETLACQWALYVQEALMQEEWPVEVADFYVQAAKEPRPPCGHWLGVRVAMGISRGELVTSNHRTTGLLEYNGAALLAARELCCAARGGEAYITSDVFDNLQLRGVGKIEFVTECINPRKTSKESMIYAVFMKIHAERWKDLGSAVRPEVVVKLMANLLDIRVSASEARSNPNCRMVTTQQLAANKDTDVLLLAARRACTTHVHFDSVLRAVNQGVVTNQAAHVFLMMIEQLEKQGMLNAGVLLAVAAAEDENGDFNTPGFARRSNDPDDPLGLKKLPISLTREQCIQVDKRELGGADSDASSAAEDTPPPVAASLADPAFGGAAPLGRGVSFKRPKKPKVHPTKKVTVGLAEHNGANNPGAHAASSVLSGLKCDPLSDEETFARRNKVFSESRALRRQVAMLEENARIVATLRAAEREEQEKAKQQRAAKLAELKEKIKAKLRDVAQKRQDAEAEEAARFSAVDATSRARKGAAAGRRGDGAAAGHPSPPPPATLKSTTGADSTRNVRRVTTTSIAGSDTATPVSPPSRVPTAAQPEPASASLEEPLSTQPPLPTFAGADLSTSGAPLVSLVETAAGDVAAKTAAGQSRPPATNAAAPANAADDSFASIESLLAAVGDDWSPFGGAAPTEAQTAIRAVEDVDAAVAALKKRLKEGAPPGTTAVHADASPAGGPQGRAAGGTRRDAYKAVAALRAQVDPKNWGELKHVAVQCDLGPRLIIRRVQGGGRSGGTVEHPNGAAYTSQTLSALDEATNAPQEAPLVYRDELIFAAGSPRAALAGRTRIVANSKVDSGMTGEHARNVVLPSLMPAASLTAAAGPAAKPGAAVLLMSPAEVREELNRLGFQQVMQRSRDLAADVHVNAVRSRTAIDKATVGGVTNAGTQRTGVVEALASATEPLQSAKLLAAQRLVQLEQQLQRSATAPAAAAAVDRDAVNLHQQVTRGFLRAMQEGDARIAHSRRRRAQMLWRIGLHRFRIEKASKRAHAEPNEGARAHRWADVSRLIQQTAALKEVLTKHLAQLVGVTRHALTAAAEFTGWGVSGGGAQPTLPSWMMKQESAEGAAVLGAYVQQRVAAGASVSGGIATDPHPAGLSGRPQPLPTAAAAPPREDVKKAAREVADLLKVFGPSEAHVIDHDVPFAPPGALAVVPSLRETHMPVRQQPPAPPPPAALPLTSWSDGSWPLPPANGPDPAAAGPSGRRPRLVDMSAECGLPSESRNAGAAQYGGRLHGTTTNDAERMDLLRRQAIELALQQTTTAAVMLDRHQHPKPPAVLRPSAAANPLLLPRLAGPQLLPSGASTARSPAGPTAGDAAITAYYGTWMQKLNDRIDDNTGALHRQAAASQAPPGAGPHTARGGPDASRNPPHAGRRRSTVSMEAATLLAAAAAEHAPSSHRSEADGQVVVSSGADPRRQRTRATDATTTILRL